MYELYLFVTAGILFYSWTRKRDIFDPFFLYCTIVLAMFASDFLVSGYSERILGDITIDVARDHQVTLLVMVVLCVAGAQVVNNFAFRRMRARVSITSPTDDQQPVFFWAALIVLAAELLKRLVAANWSLDAVREGTLSGYGDAPWRGGAGELKNLGDSSFLLGVLTTLLPIAGMLFGYVAICRTTLIRRYLAVLGLLAVAALLILNGSRLPLLSVAAFVAALLWQSSNRWQFRLFVAALTVLILAAATSFMYLYRAEGFGEVVFGPSTRFEFTYHQDDNHHQILNSMDIAESTSQRWDPMSFAYAILVNPIPRYFWENKPALTQEFWGLYKNEWTTISMAGEYVALFGVYGGVLATIVTSVLLFALIKSCESIPARPGGIILYVAIVVYVYMVHRSLLNISQAFYPLAFLAAVYWFAKKFAEKRSYNGQAQSVGSRQVHW